MKALMTLAGVALLSLAIASSAHAEGDATAGEKVFKKCFACHKVGEGAKNGVGPILNGVIGRPAGTAEGFVYSKLNHNAGANGLVWTEATIFDYLADPNTYLKKFLTDGGKADQIAGATKMTFKLPAETDRQNVIAYLKQFSQVP
jgi:cytochrome c